MIMSWSATVAGVLVYVAGDFMHVYIGCLAHVEVSVPVCMSVRTVSNNYTFCMCLLVAPLAILLLAFSVRLCCVSISVLYTSVWMRRVCVMKNADTQLHTDSTLCPRSWQVSLASELNLLYYGFQANSKVGKHGSRVTFPGRPRRRNRLVLCEPCRQNSELIYRI